MALVAGFVPAAGAHGDEVVVLVDEPEQVGDLRYSVRVRVEFANDGDPVEDTRVTVTGSAADGTPLEPTALERGVGEGLFVGEVTLPVPGAWTLTFAADGFEQVASIALDVAAQPASTTSSSSPPSSPPSSRPLTTSVPPTDAPVAGTPTSEGGRGTGALLAVGAIAALLAAIAAVALRSRSE